MARRMIPVTTQIENGAHHSDLSHSEPDPAVDTPDVTAARAQVGDVIAAWLDDISKPKPTTAA